MDIPISVILTVVGIIVSVLIFRYGIMKDSFATNEKICSRLTALETNEATFWKILGPSLATVIHSPIHVRRDALMDKLFNTENITYHELCELKPMLEEAANDNNGEKTKRLFAAYSLVRVTQLLHKEKIDC